MFCADKYELNNIKVKKKVCMNNTVVDKRLKDYCMYWFATFLFLCTLSKHLNYSSEFNVHDREKEKKPKKNREQK